MGIPDAEKNTDSHESIEQQLNTLKAERDNLDKRLKDTQKAFTQSQQQAKALEAQIGELKIQLTQTSPNLNTPEMEELKLLDPEAWYAKRRELEIAHAQSLEARLNEAGQTATKAEQQRQNAIALSEVTSRNPKITPEYIESEIPIKLKRELDNGEISFAEFLNKVEAYANKEVAIGSGNSVMTQPNLSDMGNKSGVSDDVGTYKGAMDEYMQKGI